MVTDADCRAHGPAILAAVCVVLAFALPAGAQNHAGASDGPTERDIHSSSPVDVTGERTGWFPATSAFDPPQASSREPRLGVGLVWSNLLQGQIQPRERPPVNLETVENPDREVQGVANLGTSRPVWGSRIGEGLHLSIDVEGGVSARFRLEPRGKDLVGTDWLAAVPVSLATERWSARLRLIHWSAHLGDETLEALEARSISFSRDAVELLVAYRPVPGLRFYGGGDRPVRSSLPRETVRHRELLRDRGELQGGMEARWTLQGGDGPVLSGALDWRTADRTAWQNQWTLAGGGKMLLGTQEISLLVLHTRGPSSLGQFFLSSEDTWGMQVSLGW